MNTKKQQQQQPLADNSMNKGQKQQQLFMVSKIRTKYT